MSDVIDRNVIMLAPEKWRGREWLAKAQHVACRRLTLALRNHPMLDADLVPGIGITPSTTKSA
jgi:hypothetical protein